MGVQMMDAVAKRRPLVTVVTPVFNEFDNLPQYVRAVQEKLLSCRDVDFEVLFVEDGSRDGSWQAIQEICRLDRRFQGMRLSRNFGSHAALSAGLEHARGDAVAILACDLQDPPETILEFVRRWQEGARVVWGRRRSRADSWWRVRASRFLEGMLRRHAMPAGSRFSTGSFLLMDRRVLECYRQFQEANRVTFALVAWTGFEQDVVEYDRRARVHGKSKWQLHRLVKAAYDTFLAFSQVPFTLITGVGVALFLLSFVLGVYLIVCYLTGDPKPGWVSIMLALATFFGLHFIFMSIQGEYLSRIYSESVRRPLYFISETTQELKATSHEAA
jgi:glycosyltransferase involved in cell wall biosynthesis